MDSPDKRGKSNRGEGHSDVSDRSELIIPFELIFSNSKLKLTNLTEDLKRSLFMEGVYCDLDKKQFVVELNATVDGIIAGGEHLDGNCNLVISRIADAVRQRDKHLRERELEEEFLRKNPPAPAKEPVIPIPEGVNTTPSGDLPPQETLPVPKKYSEIVKNDDLEKCIRSWADFMDESELATGFSNDQVEKGLLLKAIREKTNIGGENRVILPGNIKTILGDLFDSINACAKVTNVNLIFDSTISIKLSRADLWSNDINKRDAALDFLKNKDNEKELAAVSNLAALQVLIGSVPDERLVSMSGPGKLAASFIMHLVAGVYLEQAYDIPMASSQKLWRTTENLRTKLSADLQIVLGDANAAQQLVLAVEILYRKFIRHVIKNGNEEHMGDLVKMADSLTKKLVAKSTTIFTRCLHTQTLHEDIEIPDPKRKGAVIKQTISKTSIVRPKVPDGPKTVKEATAFAALNDALNAMESRITEYEDFNHGSPSEWASRIKGCVELTYKALAPIAKTIVNRKNIVRDLIYASRKAKDPSAIVVATKTKKPDPITSSEWENQVRTLIAGHGAEWEKASTEALLKFGGPTVLDILQDTTPEQISRCVATLIDPCIQRPISWKGQAPVSRSPQASLDS